MVASETGKWITSDLAIITLEKALQSQKKKTENLILHSDQGSQFTSIQFISYCQKHGITQSRSAAGCPMERYYNTFKAELVNRFNCRNDDELTHAFQSMHMFGTTRFVRTHTTVIERHMKQGLVWLNLDSGVTKLLDHYSVTNPLNYKAVYLVLYFSPQLLWMK